MSFSELLCIRFSHCLTSPLCISPAVISYLEFTVTSAKMRSLLIGNKYMPFILLFYREKFYFDTFRVPRSNRKLLFPVTLTPHLNGGKRNY